MEERLQYLPVSQTTYLKYKLYGRFPKCCNPLKRLRFVSSGIKISQIGIMWMINYLSSNRIGDVQGSWQDMVLYLIRMKTGYGGSRNNDKATPVLLFALNFPYLSPPEK